MGKTAVPSSIIQVNNNPKHMVQRMLVFNLVMEWLCPLLLIDPFDTPLTLIEHHFNLFSMPFIVNHIPFHFP